MALISSLIDGQPTLDITEVFVLRKYRRLGVGEALARYVFDQVPGRWQARRIAGNVSAQAF